MSSIDESEAKGNKRKQEQEDEESNNLLNEQIINQQNQILLEVQSYPLIGPLSSPTLLIPEYESNIDARSGFIPGLNYLASKYLMRKIRGDGNCFYRSFLFSYLENIISDYNNSYEDELLKRRAVNEHTRMLKRIQDCKEELIILGYSEIAFECFYDVTLELIQDLLQQSRDTLFLKFQEDGPSEYYVWFMRLLTAAAMKRQADRFLPYVMDDFTHDMDTFIAREVEPMGRECEQVQIMALTEYLGVLVKIEYLDGKPFDSAKGLTTIVCPEELISDTAFVVTLLYRPGHYDILYSNST